MEMVFFFITAHHTCCTTRLVDQREERSEWVSEWSPKGIGWDLEVVIIIIIIIIIKILVI
jgi:hypothetical protein